MWRKIIDFGLVVLIWMTQLIVYPGFTYFAAQDLLRLHVVYTNAISILVGPLMLAQAALHVYHFLAHKHWTNALSLCLLVLVWIHTFAFAVPLHNELAQGIHPLESAAELVSLNWSRTILWTLVFVMSVLSPHKK